MEYLEEVKNKAGNMDSMVALRTKIENAVTVRDNAVTALATQATLITKGTEHYTAEKNNADAIISQAETSLANLKTKIDADTDATYTAPEKALYATTVSNCNALINP